MSKESAASELGSGTGSPPKKAGVCCRNENRQIVQSSALEDTADFNYNNGQWPERLQGAEVSWRWFEVFGARPSLGRVFTPAEDQPNANYEVVLAYDTWRRLFASDKNIVGRTIRLNKRDYRIIGVMGEGFKWPNPEADLRTPLGLAPGESTTPLAVEAVEFRNSLGTQIRGRSPLPATLGLPRFVIQECKLSPGLLSLKQVRRAWYSRTHCEENPECQIE